MINIHCKECNVNLHISESNMKNKTQIKCLNCDAELPTAILNTLKEYSTHKVEADSFLKKAIDTAESKEYGDKFKGGIWKINIS